MSRLEASHCTAFVSAFTPMVKLEVVSPSLYKVLLPYPSCIRFLCKERKGEERLEEGGIREGGRGRER